MTEVNGLIIVIVDLHKAIKICPAVMFADSRTDRVIGRIIWLTDSISTINCERAIGVLRGTRCLRKWLVLLIMLKTINPIHIGKAILRLKAMWALRQKIYGVIPKMLINKINIKRDSIMLNFPFLFLLLIVDISSFSIEFIIHLFTSILRLMCLCMTIEEGIIVVIKITI